MARPVSFAEQSFRDYSNELSHWHAAVASITPANQATQTTNITALYTAATNLTLGQEAKEAIILTRSVISKLPASSKLAQRENKWLVQYHDSAGGSFKLEIPCADLTLVALNSDKMDHSNAKYTAFKTAFEAVAVSPDDPTLAVTLDEITFVGRNL